MKKKRVSEPSVARALENLAYDQRNILEAMHILNQGLGTLLRGMASLIERMRADTDDKESIGVAMAQQGTNARSNAVRANHTEHA